MMSRQIPSVVQVEIKVPKALMDFLREALPLAGVKMSPEKFVLKSTLGGTPAYAFSTVPVKKWPEFDALAEKYGIRNFGASS